MLRGNAPAMIAPVKCPLSSLTKARANWVAVSFRSSGAWQRISKVGDQQTPMYNLGMGDILKPLAELAKPLDRAVQLVERLLGPPFEETGRVAGDLVGILAADPLHSYRERLQRNRRIVVEKADLILKGAGIIARPLWKRMKNCGTDGPRSLRTQRTQTAEPRLRRPSLRYLPSSRPETPNCWMPCLISARIGVRFRIHLHLRQTEFPSEMQ
jgi:hypothetical protein